MKICTLIITIILVTCNAYAQSAKAMLLNPNVYRTKVELKATRLLDKNSLDVYRDEYIIKIDELGYLDYKIINDDENGYVIIRVLPKVKLSIEESDIEKGEVINVVRHTKEVQNENDSTNAYNYYFGIKKSEFSPMSKTLLSTKIVGIPLVQPLKLRPSKGDVGWNLEGEFTLSYNFGIRMKLDNNPFTKNFISVVPYGFGVGSAKYFFENSDESLSDKKDSYALTYYQGGLVLTIHKVHLGFFIGFDAMIDQQNNWFYQGEPWFSFGLGYKFKNE